MRGESGRFHGASEDSTPRTLEDRAELPGLSFCVQKDGKEAMPEKLTAAECRAILGDTAANKSDAEIEALRDELERVAGEMYSEVMREQTERVRWAAYAQDNPEDAV